MTEQATNQSQDERQFAVQRIYVKDISFETPNSPEIFRAEGQPTNNLSINTTVKPLDENHYEVVLTVTLTTKLEEKTVYIAEVQHAGIFLMSGFPDQEKGPMLGVYAPNQLFPYVREVVSDLINKGSFPQMVLQPVNFEAIYMQHQQQMAQKAKEAQQGQGEAQSTH